MNIDNLLVRAAVCVCIVLLSIILSIAAHEQTMDDGLGITGIFLGLYLYSTYMLMSMMWGKPGNRKTSIQEKVSLKKNQQQTRNEVYEY